jgi:hypothetical protein
MSRGSEALTMALTALAIKMVQEDPELIERLRQYAAKTDAPFEAADINGTLLELAYTDVLANAKSLIDGERHSHAHAMAGMVLPIPNGGRAAADSAEALAAASFAVEFIHSVPGRIDAFNSWMQAEHPNAVEGEEPMTTAELEAADQMLTFMARAAEKIAQSGRRPDFSVSTDELFPRQDDGTRNV